MLNVVSKDEAVEIVKSKTNRAVPENEKVNIENALGRTLCEDIVSPENVPAFDRTTVDGYAVHADDTFGASASIPAQLEIAGEILMGENADFSLESSKCVKISTGGMLPAGANAAVMVEHTDNADGLCLVYKSVAPYENVTKTGDDIAVGETALKKGTVITPAEIGILASLGIYEIPVYKKPVIAIISTGDEIVKGDIKAGQIRDVNTYLLSSAVQSFGCKPYVYGAVRDDYEEIRNAVSACLEKADAVIVSGGSSAGARDMTVKIIDELGEVFFHGIAMKPGKPTIFGTVNGKPVFGLPGHPLAAYFVFRLIVCEYIKQIMNLSEEKSIKNAVLSVNIPSNHGREEYLCVKLNENGEAVPLHTKSGIISVLRQAEGFIKIPRDSEGIDRGTTVGIYRL